MKAIGMGGKLGVRWRGFEVTNLPSVLPLCNFMVSRPNLRRGWEFGISPFR